MRFEENTAKIASSSLEEELINSISNDDARLYDDEIRKSVCLSAINSAMFSHGFTDYKVKIEKTSSKNIYSNYHYNISFDSNTAFNSDIYNIVLSNCKKYEMKNYVFTITKNLNEVINMDHINDSAPKYTETEKSAYQLNQILDHGRFFKNTVISRSNCPIGNLSDYLLFCVFSNYENNPESLSSDFQNNKVSEL